MQLAGELKLEPALAWSLERSGDALPHAAREHGLRACLKLAALQSAGCSNRAWLWRSRLRVAAAWNGRPQPLERSS